MNADSQHNKPEFGGECALAVSLGKPGVHGSANHALSADGKTYYFKNGIARFLWKLMPNRADKAQAAWSSNR